MRNTCMYYQDTGREQRFMKPAVSLFERLQMHADPMVLSPVPDSSLTIFSVFHWKMGFVYPP